MKIQYTGLSDERRITTEQINRLDLADPITEDLVWQMGSVVEVDDVIGAWLLGADREFKDPDYTPPAPVEDPGVVDERTPEELLAAAKELGIKGTGKLSDDDIRDQVHMAEYVAAQKAAEEPSLVDPSPNASGEAGSQPEVS